MKFKEYLQEEWYKNIDVGYSKHDYIDIFVNPSIKELREIETINNSNEIRFIVKFPEEKIYVWSAWKAIHGDVEQELNPNYSWSKYDWSNNFWGVAKFTGTKLLFISSDEMRHYKNFRKSFMEKWQGKDDWTKKYFADGSIIDVVKNRYFTNEEYIHRNRKKDWEIHKNPSLKDMIKIGKQFEKKDLQKSLRLVIDLSTNDFYAAPVGYLHDDMVKDLGLSLDTYRAIIRIENGGIWFKYMYNEDGVEDYGELDDILDLFKDKGIKTYLNDD